MRRGLVTVERMKGDKSVYRARRVLARRLPGSSWPVLVDTPEGVFLAKLRGAGHGLPALVAEVVVAHLAERLGLRVPSQVLIVLGDDVVCDDPDPELINLVRASRGVNLGFVLVDGARDFRREDAARVSADEAAIVTWLDWLVVNADRTSRNPNLLVRGRELWLIDHGSALTFQHDWRRVTEDLPRRALLSLSSHPLAARVRDVAPWDELLAGALDREALLSAVAAVPDEFLRPLVAAPTAAALRRRREAYAAFLWKRLKPPRTFAAALA